MKIDKYIINQIILLYIFFVSIAYCKIDIENASSYNLNFNRETLRAGEVTSLIINVNISEDYYIYS